MGIERTSIFSDIPTPAMQGFKGRDKIIILLSLVITYAIVYLVAFHFFVNDKYVCLIVCSLFTVVHLMYGMYFYRVVSKIDDYVSNLLPESFGETLKGWRRIFHTIEFNVLISFGLLFSLCMNLNSYYKIWGKTLFITAKENITIISWLLLILDQIGNLILLGLSEAFKVQSNILIPVFPWGSLLVYLMRIIIVMSIFLSLKRWYVTKKLINKNIKELEGYLKSVEAQEQLKKLGAKAVPALIKALNSKNDNTREYASETLGYIGDKRAVPMLLKLLNDKNEHVRVEAVDALGVCGNGEHLAEIRKLSEDEESKVRKTVIIVMSVFKDKNNIPILKKALTDPNEEVREAAIKSLTILLKEDVGNQDDFQYLMENIKQKSGLEQLEALEGIATSFPEKTVPFLEDIREKSGEDLIKFGTTDLIHRIRSKEIFEDSPWKKDEIDEREDKDVESEAPIYTKRDYEVLIKLLNSNLEDIRDEAARLLGEIKENKAVPALVQALNDQDPFVRSAAISALKSIEDKTVIDKIVKLLDDKEKDVRKEVVETVREFESLEYLPKIIEAFNNEIDEDVKQDLFDCICDLDEGRNVDLIIKCLSDKSPEIRETAVKYFTEYSEPRIVPVLLKLLEKEIDEFLLTHIIDALLKTSDKSIVPKIKKFLSHKSKWVRRSAKYLIESYKVEKKNLDLKINKNQLYEKLNKYPFFNSWKAGKLSKKLFMENMEAFKQDFFSEDGISPKEYEWILNKELENNILSPASSGT